MRLLFGNLIYAQELYLYYIYICELFYLMFYKCSAAFKRIMVHSLLYRDRNNRQLKTVGKNVLKYTQLITLNNLLCGATN